MTAPRRTQEQRREQTIARLVDAAIATLAEQGYSGARTAGIAARAGVSEGALFRHFPTRRALLSAAAAEVAQRQVAEFRERAPGSVQTPRDIRITLGELVRLGSNRENRTWQELMVASRTDAQLREELRPATELYQREMAITAAQLIGPHVDPPKLIPLLRVLISFTDGLALAGPLTHSGTDIAAAIDTFTELLAPLLRPTDQEGPPA